MKRFTLLLILSLFITNIDAAGHRGFNISVTSIEPFQSGLKINLKYNNTTYSQLSFGNPKGFVIINGQKYTSAVFYFGNKTDNWYINYAFPSGVPVKGYMYVRNVDSDDISTDSVSMVRVTIEERIDYKDHEYSYDFYNLPITQLDNTGSPDIKCPDSRLTIAPVSFKRVGKDAVLTFKVTNNSRATINKGISDFCTIDSNGDYSSDRSSSLRLMQQNKDVSSFQPGQTVTCQFTIHDVPTAVQNFPYIKITNGDTSFVFRNQKLQQAQPTRKSTKKR